MGKEVLGRVAEMTRQVLFWVAALTAGLVAAGIASALMGGTPTVCQVVPC